MTTLLFLVLLLLFLRALGRPVSGPPRAPAVTWSEVGARLAGDVLAGGRLLGRLHAAGRDRVGRPWS
ncbi:hypothetical protein GCU60_13055 [Blastococcus saxobsidens]|uniref:Uncharacterized protein n=1 Tax=Blastococcus saxobsidens TaxID=138336 RepID=A0A6L9W5L1_9ACTN|nr:hypothetical protein [Blastococcus saxobsidens]NEK86674.1 hypothetical protein [Blastococcus saxobsidens]